MVTWSDDPDIRTRAATRVQAMQRGKISRRTRTNLLEQENKDMQSELRDKRKETRALEKRARLMESLDGVDEQLAAAMENEARVSASPTRLAQDRAAEAALAAMMAEDAARKEAAARAVEAQLAESRAQQDAARRAEQSRLQAVRQAESDRLAAAAAAARARREKEEREVQDARRERRRRTEKLRRATMSIMAVESVRAAAAAVKYGFVGFASESSRWLASLLCESRGAVAGVVATAREAGDATAATLERQYGRHVAILPTPHEVAQHAQVVVLDVASADAAIELLSALSLGSHHILLCLVPTLSLAQLQAACPSVPPLQIVRAIALPAVRVLADASGAASARTRYSHANGGRGVSFADDSSTAPKATTTTEPAPANAPSASRKGSDASTSAAGQVATAAAAQPLPAEKHAKAASAWGAAAASGRAAAAGGKRPEAISAPPAAPEEDLAAIDTPTASSAPTRGAVLTPQLRPAFAVSVVQGSLSAALPRVGTFANLFEQAGAVLIDILDPLDWTSGAAAPLPVDAPTVVAGPGDTLQLCNLDTMEAKEFVGRGDWSADARRVSLPLCHGELCARLLFEDAPVDDDEERAAADAESPVALAPLMEQRRAAMLALLPAFQRGLLPLLRAVDARGKSAAARYQWASRADYERACLDFTTDFVLPQLHHLHGKASPTIRHTQLSARESLTQMETEAAAATRRQATHVAAMAHAQAAPVLLRTTADENAAAAANADLLRAQGRLTAAEQIKSWGAAAAAARAAAAAADAVGAAYTCPSVGSRVRIESKGQGLRSYMPAETWEGVVVRHARSQNAYVVQMDSGAVRIVASGDRSHRIVEVAR